MISPASASFDDTDLARSDRRLVDKRNDLRLFDAALLHTRPSVSPASSQAYTYLSGKANTNCDKKARKISVPVIRLCESADGKYVQVFGRR